MIVAPTMPMIVAPTMQMVVAPTNMPMIVFPMMIAPMAQIIAAPNTEHNKKKTMRNKRWKAKMLIKAGKELPPELLNLEPGINGRPRLSDEDIALPEHRSARRTRTWQSNKCGAAAPLGLGDPKAAGALALLVYAPSAPVSAAPVSAAPVSATAEPAAAALTTALTTAALTTASLATASLATAEAEADAEAEAEAEAEDRRIRAAEWREMRLNKLKRDLDARNASDDKVADGPKAIRLQSFARSDHGCEPCAIMGAECEVADAVRRMRCCGVGVCARCLGSWLQLHNHQVDTGYTDGVQGVNHVRRGRKLQVPMQTHNCPWCRRPVHSVRRALT